MCRSSSLSLPYESFLFCFQYCGKIMTDQIPKNFLSFFKTTYASNAFYLNSTLTVMDHEDSSDEELIRTHEKD